jgi:NADH-quinone oxidoreductase subunit J
MDDTGTVVAFYALSVMTIGSALGVIAVRNLIHAVVFLVLSFLGVAGLYITLSADFVGVAQILIYSGAVSILVIFAIVLTPQSGRNNQETFMRLPALVVAGCVGAVLAFAAIDTDWNISDRGGFEETASLIGEALLDKYILPFEIAAALMLVAMLGAIVLVRPEGVTAEPEE